MPRAACLADRCTRKQFLDNVEVIVSDERPSLRSLGITEKQYCDRVLLPKRQVRNNLRSLLAARNDVRRKSGGAKAWDDTYIALRLRIELVSEAPKARALERSHSNGSESAQPSKRRSPAHASASTGFSPAKKKPCRAVAAPAASGASSGLRNARCAAQRRAESAQLARARAQHNAVRAKLELQLSNERRENQRVLSRQRADHQAEVRSLKAELFQAKKVRPFTALDHRSFVVWSHSRIADHDRIRMQSPQSACREGGATAAATVAAAATRESPLQAEVRTRRSA